MNLLRCFIADDEPAARQRLQRLLGALPEVCVVGEAADGVSALERLEGCRPDVLLLDIAMPELDGLGAAALAAAPDQLSRRLGAAQFLRVHRGAIINLALLRELVHEGDRRCVAVLADRAGTRVPVSRESLAALRAALEID